MNQRYFTAFFFCLFSQISLGAFCNGVPQNNSKLTEAYDPTLFNKLKSVDDILNYTDTTYSGWGNELQLMNYIDSIIQQRFYHGYSRYTINDNLIAGFAGQFVWNHLSAIVIPDDMMKYPNAACSQQSIILMECAKRLGFDYRKVGFDHHYTLEIKLNGRWIFFDANLEIKGKRASLQEHLQNGTFYALYKDKMTLKDYYKLLANPHYGEINAEPAPRATLFHKATFLIIDMMPHLFLVIQVLLSFIYLRKLNTGRKLPSQFSFNL